MMRAFITSVLAITCMADAYKFCAPVNPLGGSAEYSRVGKCLYDHRDQLDSACKAAMKDWVPNGKPKR